jgi:hypothetical protein
MEIQDDQIEIGNNLGRINGWVSRQAVRARVISIED